jgi:hypothetical protein
MHSDMLFAIKGLVCEEKRAIYAVFAEISPNIVQCTHVVSAQQTDRCAKTAHFSLNERVFFVEIKLVAKLMCFDAQSKHAAQSCLRN